METFGQEKLEKSIMAKEPREMVAVQRLLQEPYYQQ